MRPRERGNYRITCWMTGRRKSPFAPGQVEVYTPRGVETVTAGKTMLVRGDPSSPEYQIVAAIAPDDWDRWNADRDRGLETAGNNVYNRYVSPDVYGAESLEGYGRWVSTPDYGNGMDPAGGRGLGALSRRPLGVGRLLWLDVGELRSVGLGALSLWPLVLQRAATADGAGGRARSIRATIGRPPMSGSSVSAAADSAWASASAMWAGCRWRRLKFSIRGGAAGSMAAAADSITAPRIVNNVNVYNSYRNARVANGVTAVNSRDFSSGRFRNFVRPGQGDLSSAGMVKGRLGITPSSRSMHFSDRAVSNVPRSTGNQRFFTRQGAVTTGGVGSSRGGATSGGSFRPGNTTGGDSTGGGAARRRRREARMADGVNSAALPAGRTRERSAVWTPSPTGSPSRGMTGGGNAPTGGGNSGGGWRRFGAPGGTEFRRRDQWRSEPRLYAGRRERSASRLSQIGAAPRSQFSSPNDSSGRIQVNPPMVRERSAPHTARLNIAGRTASYDRPSTPQYNRPSTPQYSRQHAAV